MDVINISGELEKTLGFHYHPRVGLIIDRPERMLFANSNQIIYESLRR